MQFLKNGPAKYLDFNCSDLHRMSILGGYKSLSCTFFSILPSVRRTGCFVMVTTLFILKIVTISDLRCGDFPLNLAVAVCHYVDTNVSKVAPSLYVGLHS